MHRSIIRRGVVLAGVCLLTSGCLSGAYEKDFQARLAQYRREAAGERPAPPAAAAAEPAAN